MLALRLPKDLEARLDAMAKMTGRTKSYYARLAIIEKLDDLEDYFLAEERLRNDTGERIPLEQVMAESAIDIAPLDEEERNDAADPCSNTPVEFSSSSPT
ncbi:MAG: ribbon-helix-helix protein, CopG family [Alphaproteobacteria bacterium]|nr:ribbon-helix-helix protein, CopG family [Alphaproteobacteria bacterium]